MLFARNTIPGIWNAGLIFVEVPGLEASLYNKEPFLAICVSSQYEVLT